MEFYWTYVFTQLNSSYSYYIGINNTRRKNTHFFILLQHQTKPETMLAKGTKAPFHLITDTDLTILKTHEAWGEKKMYGKVTEGTLRTTYIVDEQGIIIDAIGRVDTKKTAA